MAHGHVEALFEQGADHVFLPNVLNEETEFPDVNSHACPWGQTLPFVIRTAPRLERYRDRLLTPRVRFRLGIDQLERDLQPLAASLGAGKARLHDAVTAADAAMQAFRAELAAAGRAALADLETSGKLGIVVIGRPYNIYDKGVNMDIPRKLRTFYGVNVIPMDFLPLKGIDVRDVVPNMYWNYGQQDPPGGHLRGRS